MSCACLGCTPSGELSYVGHAAPDFARGVAVVGDELFVAAYGAGLRVLDVSNPTAPTPTGHADFPGLATDVTVAGSHAFVASDYYGLVALDIADPAHPVVVSAMPLGPFGTTVSGVAADGDRLYVARGSDGVDMFEISAPGEPVFIANISTTGAARAIALLPNHVVVVAAYEAGIHIVDWDLVEAPAVVGTYDTGGAAVDVHIADGRAFVAAEGAGLIILGLENLTQPTFVGDYDTAGVASGVWVSDNAAFVADGASGLAILDVSDPTNPSFVKYVGAGTAYDVVVDNALDVAYVAFFSNGAQLVEVADLASASVIGQSQWWRTTSDATPLGNLVVVANDSLGLAIVEPTPAGAESLAFLDLPGSANSVEIVGDVALVAAGTAGVHVVNLADPSSPTYITTVDTAGSAMDIKAASDYALVADGSAGLSVLSIANPLAPTFLGSVDTPGTAVAVDAYQSISLQAAVADSAGGLQMVILASPATPSLGGVYDPSASVVDVTVSGTRAFIIEQGSGLRVVNLSPSLIEGTLVPNTTASKAKLIGSFAYLVSPNGVEVVDLGSPASPVSVATGATSVFAPYLQQVTAVGPFVVGVTMLGQVPMLERCSPIRP